MRLPPNHVPAWVDKARLCVETCASTDTVEEWVRRDILSAGQKRGGKLLWRWADVDKWLQQGGANGQEVADLDAEGMRAATRRLSRKAV
jgi:hypothetical protein